MEYYIGIDLGGTNIAAGVADGNGALLSRVSRPTDITLPFGELMERLADTGKYAAETAGIPLADIVSVGLGAPGCIDLQTGLLQNANNLGWVNVPLRAELQKHFDCPVYAENDASCAALGEIRCGAARDYSDMIMVTLGTGIGGGIILNGEIFNGCDNMGAELGHTRLVYGGRKCSCGQRGCFETYASASALRKDTRRIAKKHPDSLIVRLSGGDPSKATPREAFDAAALGDPYAEKLIAQYIDWLAAGLSSMIVIFRPQAIVIGGGVSAQGERLIAPLKERLFANTISADQIGIPDVFAAKLGNDAGIIGAALLGKKG